MADSQRALAPSRGLFVTGTDTGVGKTVIAAALLRGLGARGARVVGMKPVASGIDAGAIRNADVAALMEASNVAALLNDVNPFAFAAAVAPHIAAAQSGTTIDLDVIARSYARLSAVAEIVVVEGAGGAFTPLSSRADMLDIASRLRVPVLLVVGMRLGCLNHALLTAAAIHARGLRLAGWIANRIDPMMAACDANVAALAQRLPAPLLDDVPWHREPGTQSLSQPSLDALVAAIAA